MPIHDWTRVPSAIWHDFHLSWVAALRQRLNNGVLPADCYALSEFSETPDGGPPPDPMSSRRVLSPESLQAAINTTERPPRAAMIASTEDAAYAARRRSITIRRNDDDLVFARIEMTCPANKLTNRSIQSFVDKAVGAMVSGIHLLIVDLFSHSDNAGSGVHAAIWAAYCGGDFDTPPGCPLTFVSYSCSYTVRVYLESTAVGRELLEMPLFLEPEYYVNVPLEETYVAAYRGVPARWRKVLEASGETN